MRTFFNELILRNKQNTLSGLGFDSFEKKLFVLLKKSSEITYFFSNAFNHLTI